MNARARAFERTVPASFRVLLISGSLRSKSTNTAVVRTAALVAPDGVTTTVFTGLAGLPHFNPDDDRDPLHPAVVGLRSAVHDADALLFSTPEYAGALPGSFKNLLDWTIGDEERGSIYEKPVGWINASARGAVNAHESLRKVLGYASAVIVEAACVNIAVNGADVGADGLIGDPAIRARIADALAHLARDAPRELSAPVEAPR